MINYDITYCQNQSCPFDDCWRNAKQISGRPGVYNMSNFGGTCRQYMKYLADKLNGVLRKSN